MADKTANNKELRDLIISLGLSQRRLSDQLTNLHDSIVKEVEIVEKKEIATNDVSPSVQSDESPSCLPSMMERHDQNHSLRPSQDSSAETKETEEGLSKGQEETEEDLSKDKEETEDDLSKDKEEFEEGIQMEFGLTVLPPMSGQSLSGFKAQNQLVKIPLLNGGQKPTGSVKTSTFKTGEDNSAKAKGKAAKPKKKEKDPNAPKRGKYQGEKKRYEESRPQPPKRAKSSYIFFSNDTRAQVALDSPNMKLPDIAKELARRWSSLETAEKAKYEEMAAEDKKRYVKKKEKYDETPERKEEIKVAQKKVSKENKKKTKVDLRSEVEDLLEGGRKRLRVAEQA